MRAAACLALTVALAAPAVAPAAVRHAAPGASALAPCTRAEPCSAAAALQGSAPGDTVVLGAGTYAGQPLVVPRRLTLTARPDGPRPVVTVTAPGEVALTVGPDAQDAVVERLALRAGGEAAAAIEVAAASALEDLDVRTETAACLDTGVAGVRLVDSTFARTGASADPCLRTTGRDTSWTGVTVTARQSDTAAAYAGNGQIADGTFEGRATGLALDGTAVAHRLTARGADRGLLLDGATTVTDSVAVAYGGGDAVQARGRHTLLNLTAWASGAGSRGIHALAGSEVDVRNTIARGGTVDLAGEPGASLVARNSNFRRGAGAQDGGANQAVPPRLADPAFGDFRPRRGSPVIDAGGFEDNAAGADRAGRFRWLGRAPDIGAYEYAPPRPRRRLLDRTAPRLGAVGLTATRFRAGRRGRAFTAAAAPVGTVLRFYVSEPADVVLTVARPGRRRPVLGTIVLAAERGAGRTRLSGEVDGRLLAPGPYVLTVTARDTTQNLSRAVRLGFRVIR